jgi:DNA-directed RNA polymerase subunit RPC12/RpoP
MVVWRLAQIWRRITGDHEQRIGPGGVRLPPRGGLSSRVSSTRLSPIVRDVALDAGFRQQPVKRPRKGLAWTYPCARCRRPVADLFLANDGWQCRRCSDPILQVERAAALLAFGLRIDLRGRALGLVHAELLRRLHRIVQKGASVKTMAFLVRMGGITKYDPRAQPRPPLPPGVGALRQRHRARVGHGLEPPRPRRGRRPHPPGPVLAAIRPFLLDCVMEGDLGREAYHARCVRELTGEAGPR